MNKWKEYKLGDTNDMYTKTAFPIHEEDDMYTKTPNHIHVNNINDNGLLRMIIN